MSAFADGVMHSVARVRVALLLLASVAAVHSVEGNFDAKVDPMYGTKFEAITFLGNDDKFRKFAINSPECWAVAMVSGFGPNEQKLESTMERAAPSGLRLGISNVEASVLGGITREFQVSAAQTPTILVFASPDQKEPKRIRFKFTTPSLKEKLEEDLASATASCVKVGRFLQKAATKEEL